MFNVKIADQNWGKFDTGNGTDWHGLVTERTDAQRLAALRSHGSRLGFIFDGLFFIPIRAFCFP